MTAVPFRSPSPVYIGHDLLGLRMSAIEYLSIGETQERYELIDGVVLMSPSPRPRHFKVIYELLKQLDRFEERGGVADVYAETDLCVGDFAVYRPDICVYAARPIGGIPERLDTPPGLVIEVLSPGSQALDLVTNRDGYERVGVKECWVIDAQDGSTGRIFCWRTQGGRLVEFVIEGDQLASTAIAGFVLDLARLRGVMGIGRTQ